MNGTGFLGGLKPPRLPHRPVLFRGRLLGPAKRAFLVFLEIRDSVVSRSELEEEKGLAAGEQNSLEGFLRAEHKKAKGLAFGKTVLS